MDADVVALLRQLLDQIPLQLTGGELAAHAELFARARAQLPPP